MRSLFAKFVLAGLGLALPVLAFGQMATPVIPPVKVVRTQKAASAAVWAKDGTTVTLTSKQRTGTTAPTAGMVDGHATAAGAGVRVRTKPGITAHANVSEIRWAPVVPACAPGTSRCMGIAPVDGVQRGEVGAGYAGHGVKLDLSIGESQSEPGATALGSRQAPLPRVLPAAGGADVAAPLWFRNSTSTSVNARGQVSLAPNTSLDLGASVGHVKFLPGSGLSGDDSLDQTTLSLGIQHGAVSGAIVGHVLEPNLPGAALDQNQRWSGIDLGISAHLPWRGELNFGVQNVWTSGRAPLLFGSGANAPDQGRVPYVQYHQDL
ncbi:MAG TPA: hypothetical protein VF284_02245 [Rhodanobacteraceae bacterium]